jgi:hypothetical protein
MSFANAFRAAYGQAAAAEAGVEFDTRDLAAHVDYLATVYGELDVPRQVHVRPQRRTVARPRTARTSRSARARRRKPGDGPRRPDDDEPDLAVAAEAAA